MRRRRLAALAVLLLAATAAVTVADPHRTVFDGDRTYTVGPELSPSAVFRHANLKADRTP
ncbi:MAG: hypothetical protein ABEJ42_03480 [Halobacteriaceae archaeon]